MYDEQDFIPSYQNSDPLAPDIFTNEIHGSSTNNKFLQDVKLLNPKQPTTANIDFITSSTPVSIFKEKKDKANRRLIFSRRTFLDVARFLQNNIVQAVGGFLVPEFLVNSIIGIFFFPPITVLPLVALAYILLFREEIGKVGDIIDDKLCKYYSPNL